MLDMKEVTRLDSAGIGMLVSKFLTARRAGGTIKLLHPTERTDHLMNITKLTTVFEMFDDEEAAVRSFNSPRGRLGCHSRSGGSKFESSKLMTLTCHERGRGRSGARLRAMARPFACPWGGARIVLGLVLGCPSAALPQTPDGCACVPGIVRHLSHRRAGLACAGR